MIKLNLKKSILISLMTISAFLLLGTKTQNASSLNNYIASQNIKPVKITNAIWNKFPKYKYRHGAGKPEGVVVHETANNSSTIYNEIAYMKNNYRNAFVHSFIDGNKIINISNTNYLSWGAGYQANQRFVQFEQPRVHSKKAFAKQIANASYYTAYILNKYKLKPNNASYDGKGTVWSHKAVSKYLGGTDHTDPVSYYASNGRKYFNKAYTMSDFYKMVVKYYNGMNKSQTNNNGGQIETQQDIKQDDIVYDTGDGYDSASLSSNYKKYNAYSHLKASGEKYSTQKLSKKVKKSSKLYISNRATVNGNSIWYQVRLKRNTNSSKFWVSENALKFNQIDYYDDNRSDLNVKSNYNLQNKVFNNPTLSKQIGKSNMFDGSKVTTTQKAVVTSSNNKQISYNKITFNGYDYWINSNALY
ncbi:N-acetylmuramoyl-L-alanine amidase [Lactobacillus sp. S2-2]|uniref:peptidoglycan recognition protein family protein n=1 Tax=Lactobacillus sp. S2-2 TaxID=2692917 RepID=UPI001F00C852|nr:N-acetylmuramoyl-L-alanine amidase [Lactobacillus sp. S2-2]MCF6514703.1 N-acetylmuramoyl-L-alanine amidase [Lactobacillus sp. S2-2]